MGASHKFSGEAEAAGSGATVGAVRESLHQGKRPFKQQDSFLKSRCLCLHSSDEDLESKL